MKNGFSLAAALGVTKLFTFRFISKKKSLLNVKKSIKHILSKNKMKMNKTTLKGEGRRFRNSLARLIFTKKTNI